MQAAPTRPDEIHQRVEATRQRVAAAAERAGRAPGDVTLVAVAKTKPAWMVRAAAEAGCAHIGENYVQEARAKMAELAGVESAGAGPIRWHFIGHLQTNKARDVVGRFALIHSLDRSRLARELDKRAARAGLEPVPVLVEVNLGAEETKSGVRPEALAELLGACRSLERVAVRGLMAMPPPAPDPEEVRPHFRRLAELAAEHGLRELSMGMSSDFEVAIEEGATIVRVGTAIFGSR